MIKQTVGYLGMAKSPILQQVPRTRRERMSPRSFWLPPWLSALPPWALAMLLAVWIVCVALYYR